MSLLVVSDDDVSRITEKLTPHVLMALMALVFVRSSESAKKNGETSSQVVTPLRSVINTPEYTALFMPAHMREFGTSIKVVSVPRSSRDGLPGSTLVLDEHTGAVEAIVNAKGLTALRTAAGSTLATKLVGPAHPHVLLAFGSGKQIEAHLTLLLKTYTSIRQCIIINRTLNERLRTLLDGLRYRFPNVTFTSGSALDGVGQHGFDLKHNVLKADIICTATSSTKPLFRSSWVKVGTHINLVGSYTPEMREIDDDLVKRAGKILVDSREACAHEAGELISAGISPADMVEVGEIVEIDGEGIAERVIETKSAGDVSIFKSVGIGLQDTAIAHLVVKNAIANNIGVRVDYDRKG
ncbi:NAD-binding protein [Schizopora paradoxa]|uniref:NAD-binding protein n=1 Tax=Schizopora paradoxa TaxID=27342 RepID=A0A0H2R6J8_9AGAM|nr:NAD-binding protein [Schizopora paradoxa]